MNRHVVLCLVLGAFGAGCSSGPVRDGIWELSFEQAYFTQSGEDASGLLPPREVKVLTSMEDDGTPILEITSLEDDENLKPIYAEVRPGQFEDRPVIKVDQQIDKDWSWHMVGNVKDQFTIIGTRIDARGRFGRARDIALEGRWKMRWLRDVDA
jgi:hypothetical protein